MKLAADERLAAMVAEQLQVRGIEAAADERLAHMCGLFKDRCATVVELAQWLQMYFAPVEPTAEDLQTHVTDAVRPAIATLAERLAAVEWGAAPIQQAFKAALAEHGLKMPQLAHPVRVLVCGRAQTPSIDAVLSLFSRDTVLARLRGA
jgi:glutamyl-tRNA synthetase